MKDFRFKKEFGQNFIFDTSFLQEIVKSFSLDKNSSVLEIGAGMGTLTSVLCENTKKVVSFEIDKTLKERLQKLEGTYPNLKVYFEDILSKKIDDIENLFEEDYYIVSNIPYYITSPIIFKFLLESKRLKKMYLMVQKEVAERLASKKSHKEYGASTVILNTFASCRILKIVDKSHFKPVPKVDSAVIEIDLKKNKFDIKNVKNYIDFVSLCFKMKRKTLFNNLIKSFSENRINKLFVEKNFSKNIRPEEVEVEDFVFMYNFFC